MLELVSIPGFSGYYASRAGDIFSVKHVKNVPFDKIERIEAAKDGVFYKSTTHGNFKIKKLSPYKTGQGRDYLKVDLMQRGNRRKMLVSRLMMMTFEKKRMLNSKTEHVDHIDENTFNNNVKNLQVVTPAVNQELSVKRAKQKKLEDLPF